MESSSIWPQVDLLLLPSLHEGASNSVLEALAHKIAILASDIPENREILPQSSLVPLNNAKVWQCAITRILHDPKRELDRLREYQSPYREQFNFDWDKKKLDSKDLELISELIVATVSDTTIDMLDLVDSSPTFQQEIVDRTVKKLRLVWLGAGLWRSS